jgi:hypothetical protein
MAMGASAVEEAAGGGEGVVLITQLNHSLRYATHQLTRMMGMVAIRPNQRGSLKVTRLRIVRTIQKTFLSIHTFYARLPFRGTNV